MKRKIKPTRRPCSGESARPTSAGGDTVRDRIAFLTELIRSRRRPRGRGAEPDAPARFVDRLRRALRMQEADEDDVIQEAAEALLRMEEPIQSLPAWFTRTAENRKLRFLRIEKQARAFEPRLSAEIHQRGSPFPAPDEEAEHNIAVRRLIKRVHPGLRAIAARGLSGHSVEQIAAALKLPKNTVKSYWGRAKKDIGGRAVVLALLAGVWLWLVARWQRLAGAFAGNGRHGAHTLLAAAALPLIVTGHGAVAAPREPDAPRDEQAVMVERAGGRDYTFSPMLTTSAERELEWAVAARAAPLVLSADPGPDTEGEEAQAARGLLDQALTALQQGHLGVAKDALQLYDSEHPGNPFPSLRARIAAGLAASRSP